MTSERILHAIGIGAVFSLIVLLFLYPIPLDILNSDLGRHLLSGSIIVNSQTVPTTNLFSYTYTDYPFINTHWFSQVIFYFWHHTFGFDGLIILSVLLALLTYGAIYLFAVRRFGVLTPTLVMLLFLQVIAGRTQVRPELFSFLLLTIFLIILYHYREKYTRWVFALIPLSLLWVNTHIYFFTGSAVLVLFLIDTYLSEKNKYKSKRFQTLFIVTAASGIVTLINPNFIKGAFYPLFVLGDYGLSLRENVNFFRLLIQYPGYIKSTVIFFMISLSALWLGIGVARKKMTAIDIMLAAFFTFIGLFAIRNFPLFVIGAFIPTVKGMSYLLQLVSKRFPDKEVFIQSGIALVVTIAVIPSAVSNLTSHGLGFGVTDNISSAIDFWKKNNLKGPIYNNYDIGNYLEYRLYPEEKVYVDNRPEAYPKTFFQDVYLPMQKSPELFEKENKKYKFNAIVLAHTDISSGTRQLLHRLVREDEWQMVYINSIAVIFLKNTPENQSVISRYAIDQKNLKLSALTIDSKDKASQFINFFRAVDWPQQFYDMNLKYLEFDPANCQALHNVIYIHQAQQKPIPATYSNRYLENCS